MAVSPAVRSASGSVEFQRDRQAKRVMLLEAIWPTHVSKGAPSGGFGFADAQQNQGNRRCELTLAARNQSAHIRQRSGQAECIEVRSR